MAQSYMELVGIMLSHNAKLKRVKVRHLCKMVDSDNRMRFKWVNGLDKELMFPFSRMVSAFNDAYAHSILKIWDRQDRYVVQRYYELFHACGPRRVGLGGRWRLWAER